MDAATRTLVDRAAGGDSAAFEDLIRRYARLVHAEAYCVLRHRQEAEDAVQEAFFKGFRALPKLKDRDFFVSWLLSIARNHAMDMLRKRKPSVEEVEAADQPDPASADPAKRLEAAEVRALVLDAVANLPEQQRRAVTLRYIEGQDYSTIRDSLEITDGSLRGMLGRGLEALRKALGKGLRESGPVAGTARIGG